MVTSKEDAAALLLDTVPPIMQFIRRAARNRSPRELTVPQFRALVFLGCRSKPHMTELSDHLGLTLPTVSKMIERLTQQRLVERRSVETGDRRLCCLTLTPEGSKVVSRIREEARNSLSSALVGLSQSELSSLQTVLKRLRPLFDSTPAPIHNPLSEKGSA